MVPYLWNVPCTQFTTFHFWYFLTSSSWTLSLLVTRCHATVSVFGFILVITWSRPIGFLFSLHVNLCYGTMVLYLCRYLWARCCTRTRTRTCTRSYSTRNIPDDQSGFDSLYTSPFALGGSGWPGCVMDQNNWLRSTKLFSPGPLAWNSLPPEIKTTSLTLGQFSGRLKTEMFLRIAITRQRSRHLFLC